MCTWTPSVRNETKDKKTHICTTPYNKHELTAPVQRREDAGPLQKREEIPERMDSELAELYDDHSSLQYHYGRQLYHNHISVVSGQSILDLGCGTGRLARELASRVGADGSVIAIDPNFERVRVAEMELNYDPVKHRNLRYIPGLMGDAVKYGPFDWIFSNFVLHWVQEEDLCSTMASIHESLKPGGSLCANITLTTGPYASDLSLLTTGKSEEEVTGMKFRSLAYWKNHCLETGLKVVHGFQDDNMTIRFPSAREYFDFLRAYTEGAVDVEDLAPTQLQSYLKQHNIDSMDDELVLRSSILTIVAMKERNETRRSRRVKKSYNHLKIFHPQLTSEMLKGQRRKMQRFNTI
eukprot:scpid76764/ scgid28455/ Hexaprenyldihydroxybenzoate methyltransferase, mitochondrial; 2-polyprenyl-6-hydroxyphenyl methylase; 3,4-dihydroxy-5-hexaprenylbenzoate methyltransferase; 3-demethylubiquinone-9 3-methyltransferase; Dihydroxyhexaprenylbenzoate methyltransferase